MGKTNRMDASPYRCSKLSEGCEVCVTEGPQPVPYTFHYKVFLIYLNQIVIIVTIKKDNGSG